MKKLFVIALATFAMVSCAKDVEKDVQKSTIDFATSTKYVNRSTVATTDNLSNFYVWGYTDRGTTILENQLVEKTSGEWDYTPKKYWPVDSKVSFYGIYPTTLEAVSGKPANTLTTEVSSESAVVAFAAELWGMNVSAYANSVPDLIYASAVEKTKDGGKVLMKFRHAMAQVVFKIYNNTTKYEDTSANITVTTSNYLQISDMHYQGVYSLPMTASTSNEETPAQGSWNLTTNKAPWSVATNMGAVISAGETLQITDEEDVNMVIPQSGTVNVMLPCAVRQGNEVIQDHFNFDLDIDWKEGYKYIYTIEINDESLKNNLIEFTAVVVPLVDEVVGTTTL